MNRSEHVDARRDPPARTPPSTERGSRFDSTNSLSLLRYATALEVGAVRVRPGVDARRRSEETRDLARRMALEAGGQPLPPYTGHDVRLLDDAGESLCRQALVDLAKPQPYKPREDARERLVLGQALLQVRDRLRQRMS